MLWLLLTRLSRNNGALLLMSVVKLTSRGCLLVPPDNILVVAGDCNLGQAFKHVISRLEFDKIRIRVMRWEVDVAKRSGRRMVVQRHHARGLPLVLASAAFARPISEIDIDAVANAKTKRLVFGRQ